MCEGAFANDFAGRWTLPQRRPRPYFASTSLTSKISVEFGGINPEYPFAPYARSGGIRSCRFPPTFIPAIPSSHPLITCPAPSKTSIGFPVPTELSNFFPFVSHPV